MSLSLARALLTRGTSVREDWVAWLPPEKLAIFKSVSTRWERSFTMSGIALHAAFDLRDHGRFEQALSHVQMTSEIVTRNAADLAHALNVIQNEARHHGRLPQVEPLNFDNFRTDAARRVAHWNALFHWVLFDARSRFFQKLRLLETVIHDASAAFETSSEELAVSALSDLEAPWDVLADSECDLNTAAREVEVILKAFLRNLPSKFTAQVAEALESPSPNPNPQPRRSRVRS